MDWGVMKGLWLSNLRWWLSMPIFDRDGVLTIGYGYPNLCMAEGYNAPGSPYWGFKTFIALALPEDHPFWQAEEKPWAPPAVFLDPQVRMLLTREADNRQVIAYTAGNHGWEHMHENEKYEKFAYSSQFTFSVVKEANTLEKGAFDSMLAVKRAGRDLWHGRSGVEGFRLAEDRVWCRWSPMEGVTVETTIAPLGPWHVRRHVIRASEPIEAAEGAFAPRRESPGPRPCDSIATRREEGEGFACAHGPAGSSAIFALQGYDQGRVINTEPNTNLMWPRTLLPMLTAALPAGETVLVCAVFACGGDSCPTTVPEEVRHLAESL